MPLITDPDDLTIALGTSATATAQNVTVDTALKLVYLRTGALLSSDGVTLKALYSKLKEFWRTNATAIRFPFPIEPITDESMEWADWKPGDDTTRNLLRTAGWVERTGTTTNRIYAGVITLGALGSTDQVYYQQVAGGSATNVVLTGPVNQAVQVFGDSGNGNFDRRGFLRLFVRVQGKTYATSSLTDIGVTALAAQAYRFPLSNATDAKVTQPDLTVDAYGVTITWYASPQARSIGGTSRNFSIVVNGNNRTAEQIYMAVQSLLRKGTDIDSGAGTRTGTVTDELLRFVGDTLYTRYTSDGLGVFIDNYQASDINRLVFVDNTNTERTFPFTASLTLNFGGNLAADGSAIFRVFFTSLPGSDDDFGQSSAVLVNDSAGVAMSGDVSGRSAVTFTFAYDTNNQGGRTPGTDAQVTVVAMGLGTAQYIATTGVIGRNTSNSVTLTAARERNYLNP